MLLRSMNTIKPLTTHPPLTPRRRHIRNPLTRHEIPSLPTLTRPLPPQELLLLQASLTPLVQRVKLPPLPKQALRVHRQRIILSRLHHTVNRPYSSSLMICVPKYAGHLLTFDTLTAKLLFRSCKSSILNFPIRPSSHLPNSICVFTLGEEVDVGGGMRKKLGTIISDRRGQMKRGMRISPSISGQRMVCRHHERCSSVPKPQFKLQLKLLMTAGIALRCSVFYGRDRVYVRVWRKDGGRE